MHLASEFKLPALKELPGEPKNKNPRGFFFSTQKKAGILEDTSTDTPKLHQICGILRDFGKSTRTFRVTFC